MFYTINKMNPNLLILNSIDLKSILNKMKYKLYRRKI